MTKHVWIAAGLLFVGGAVGGAITQHLVALRPIANTTVYKWLPAAASDKPIKLLVDGAPCVFSMRGSKMYWLCIPGYPGGPLPQIEWPEQKNR